MGECKTGLEDTRIDRANLQLEEVDGYRWESLLGFWGMQPGQV